MNDLLLNAWSAIAHDPDGPPVLKIPRANLAELVDELGRLHRWKAEAIDVIERWDRLADKVTTQLGQRRSDAVADELTALREARHNAFSALDKREAEIARLSDALAAERALADRLAEALTWELDCAYDAATTRTMKRKALAAYDEARREQ